VWEVVPRATAVAVAAPTTAAARRSILGAVNHRWIRLVAALGLVHCSAPRPFTDVREGDATLDDIVSVDVAEEDAPAARCVPDSGRCDGNTHSVCGSDGMTRINVERCAMACDDRLGCVACVPGSRQCEGTRSSVCRPDGSGYVATRDCADWGSRCELGFCRDACADVERTRSYIGCDYWVTPLANNGLDVASFAMRITVSNPNATPARVVLTRGTTEVLAETVMANAVREITVPWIEDAHRARFNVAPYRSFTTANGAYRLRSDQPVVVAQFNPFDYYVPNADCGLFGVRCYSYSNDATILYPVHTLLGSYVAASYVPRSYSSTDTNGNTTGSYVPGYVAVVGAGLDPARVTLRASAPVARDAMGRWPDTAAGGTISFMLARGEVAHVLPQAPPLCAPRRPGFTDGTGESYCNETEFDLTGSRIDSDQPIAVFGGHPCAFVPYNQGACDHLEVQLPPVPTWGKNYVGDVITGRMSGGRNQLRVIATRDGTLVDVEPTSSGGSTFTLDAGQWRELTITGPFTVRSDDPVQVIQYLVGYDGGTTQAKGDPSMTSLVPREQWRSEYSFSAPSSYRAMMNPLVDGQNYLLIVRPRGLAITLDGAPVDATWRVAGMFETARLPIVGGIHRMSAAQPFGVISYGLGFATSYAYPTGLNLEPLVLPPG